MLTALFQPEKIKKTYSLNLTVKCLSLLFTGIWCWFYFSSKDRTDWWLENVLVVIFIAGLIFARKKFMFSDTSLVFIFLFLVLHIYGAKMAYTQNEFGEFLQDKFELVRNPYDRIVHFSFGFLMLYPLVDLMSSFFPKRNFVLLFSNMFILCLATAFELIEWAVAAFTDKVTGETYVATQGDPWDAQKDIVLAVTGAVIFTFFLKIFPAKTADKKNAVPNDCIL